MSEQEYRIESDTIGEVKIPKDALGAHRLKEAATTSVRRIDALAIIRAFLHLKKAAAESNVEVGDEPAERGKPSKSHRPIAGP